MPRADRRSWSKVYAINDDKQRKWMEVQFDSGEGGRYTASDQGKGDANERREMGSEMMQQGAVSPREEQGHLELTKFQRKEGKYPIDKVIDGVERGTDVVAVRAVAGGLRAQVLAALSETIQRPMVVITEAPDQADRLTNDLDLYCDATRGTEQSYRDRAVHFPSFDVGPFFQASADRSVAMERLATLEELSRDRAPRFVVTSSRAAMRKTIPPAIFRSYRRRYEVGDELANEDLHEYMEACGYTEVSVVEDPGTYAVRGDVVDIYSPHRQHPHRIERWGDEIVEVRLFRAESQRSLDSVEACHLYPVREAILDEASVKQAVGKLRELNASYGRPFSALHDLISDLQSGLHIVGIEALLPALHGQLADLFDYVDDDALVVVCEPEAVVRRLDRSYGNREEEQRTARQDGEYVYDVDAYYRDPSTLKDQLIARRELEWRRLEVMEDQQETVWPPPVNSIGFEVRENTDVVQLRRHYQGIEHLVGALSERLEKWREIFGAMSVVCRTRAQAERLVELLESFEQPATQTQGPLEARTEATAPADAVEVKVGRLSKGFRSEARGMALISGEEIFGQQVRTTNQKSLTEHAEISHFKDLSVGDLVVHVDFGVARYQGIEHLHVEGVGNDFLYLEYAHGDKLYLPVYRLGKVQKYIGAAGGIALDKMGGTRWERTKEQVKTDIRELAGDLLALYAKREMAKGIAFSSPDDFYREFEEAFPFEETPDQARAIKEVLKDMTKSRPMDRLICGDVGFGKTEVAMRAAMKAVVDGRQVAVLVPTTLLCEQHLLSFRERMEDFGVRVEALSRFRTRSQEKEIMADTSDGKVDVLIGTHRLLSADVDFQNLGLLVVDEEQRFGVKHKERIKRMRSEIDVLTLTATPIPRTLQMSLLGIRDLSIIATPPHNRLAVRTHVAKFSDGIIREAVMRELSRGGQVFFVHNRVSTIKEIAEHLKGVVPEARIGIGHGQMKETELEKVMYDYIRGEINVLLSTAIVESGLDIPNANTIIVNRADRFGLSQLYQLRGRVGRGNTRAYGYLLVPARRTLKADAQKRLEVMQTHTELGSGFHVATYDLEIRGAGNLLSEDQSGHVTKVGLDLYTELLDEAIHDLRGEEFDADIEPEVNIKVEAYVPDDYIPATSLRLMFYKRFSLARSHEELDQIFEEMVDRFGDPPEAVWSLKRLIGVKVDLRRLRAPRLDCGMSAVSIELDRSTPLDPGKVVDMVSRSGRWRLTSEMKLIYDLRVDESARPMKTVRRLLDNLLAL